MTTLRIASSSLESAILFAEHKDFVSAYQAVFKPSHTLRDSSDCLVFCLICYVFPFLLSVCALFSNFKAHWPDVQLSRQTNRGLHILP